MKRILFVDDLEIDRTVYGRLYETMSRCFHGQISLDYAGSLDEAEVVMGGNRPDVVVVDLVMPPDGALETISKLALKTASWPPVVVLTGAEYLPNIRERAFLSGVDDFIAKKEFARHPESCCERIYHAFQRRNRTAPR